MTTTMYPCLVVHPSSKYEVGGGPCANSASYFAIDNRAKHGHVCRFCWRSFATNEQALYSAERGHTPERPSDKEIT